MRKREYKVSLKQIQVSEAAFNYFHRKKTQGNEPIYSVVDRIINNQNKDITEIVNENEQQKKVIQIYFDRIKQLEVDKQTKLIQ